MRIDPSDQILDTGDAPASASAAIGMPTVETRVQYVPTIFAGYADLMGFHRHLLDDVVRTETLIGAIESNVRPGDTVIDLGAGTGILSLAACRAGARKVYALEHASIAGLARELARVNGYGDRIEIIKQNARGWHAPEPVDLLVSECYGMAGVGGTMIPLVAELARRCLRPGGKVIPRDVSVWLAPVESEAGHGYVNCFEKARFGFDFRPAAMMARSNIYLTYFAQEELLARPQSAACVEIASATTGRPIRSNLHFEANRSGRLDGFAGWFESELCEGVVLRTGPDTAPTIWQHCFFPLTHPRRVEAGETIDLAFAAVAGESGLPMNFHWNDQSLLGSFPSAT